jgi:uncharacterized protein
MYEFYERRVLDKTSHSAHLDSLASRRQFFPTNRVDFVEVTSNTMNLSAARTVLFYVPVVSLLLFLGLMIFGPNAHKLTVYRVFFNQGFMLAIPYAIAAFVTAGYALRANRWGTGVFVSVLALFALAAFYARYIEPSRIVIREQTIEVGVPIRVAFIADPHIGFFDGVERMQQIVDELNRLDVDVVAVGGDWTYEPQKPLIDLLAPIGKSRHRVIAVLGNHDEGMPGMRVVEELEAALRALRVENIEGKIIDIEGVRFAGIGDRFAQKDKLPVFDPTTVPHIVLGHNPDSIDRLRGTSIRLLLAGHTHGGQINLPILTERILARFTDGRFKCGLYRRGAHSVFVTAGLGTVGLPLRLFQPPVIDIINLR